MSAPFTDELFRAVADYALQFPDANSLGDERGNLAYAALARGKI